MTDFQVLDPGERNGVPEPAQSAAVVAAHRHRRDGGAWALAVGHRSRPLFDDRALRVMRVALRPPSRCGCCTSAWALPMMVILAVAVADRAGAERWRLAAGGGAVPAGLGDRDQRCSNRFRVGTRVTRWPILSGHTTARPHRDG